MDVAIVDVMLPGMSGFELSRRLKGLNPAIAVILLTARNAIDDRVRGLDSGADDYMIKPFDFAELGARIRAVTRRDAPRETTRVAVGELTIDLVRHRVIFRDKDVPLSSTEFDVLHVLARRLGETVTRREVLDAVWQTDAHIDPNIVDQYVSYLRRKLDQLAAGVRIVTERGVGFRLIVDES